MFDWVNKIHVGDCLQLLKQIPDNTVDCCVTSPPYYGLRNYNGGELEIGVENTPEQYIKNLVAIFAEVKRVLVADGTLWVNIGDSYNGVQSNALKPKDLIGIPWMLAFALRDIGYYLRQDLIWHKFNPMPESVKDRCTKAHEYIFLLSKSAKYYYDYESILETATGYDGRKATLMKGSKKYKDSGHTMAERGHERWRFKNLQDKGQTVNTIHKIRADGEGEYMSPVRNKRSVWSVPTKPFSGIHFATFPEKLIEPMISAGCPEGGIVLDPFSGAGTTAVVAKKLFRNYIGLELNPEYVELSKKRLDFPLQRGLF